MDMIFSPTKITYWS